jgi:hypothetical protein
MEPTRRLHFGRRPRHRLARSPLLGTATILLTNCLFAVSEAGARGGSGSHSFSGGSSGGSSSGSSGHLHHHFFNNDPTTGSHSGGLVAGIVIAVVVILIVGVTVYFSRRGRRAKPAHT